LRIPKKKSICKYLLNIIDIIKSRLYGNFLILEDKYRFLDLSAQNQKRGMLAISFTIHYQVNFAE